MDSNTFRFTEHLAELRSRILKSLFFIGLAFIVCYFFSAEILSFISDPIRPYLSATQGKLIFISPFEKFLSYLMLSLFSGFILASPFCFYQIWKFISPGLYPKEKSGTLLFVTAATLLFLLGLCFVYFVVYPFSFRFLLQFAGGNELPYISLKPYLSFFLRTSLVFAMVFELPLILFSLLKLNIITVHQLSLIRPYAIVGVALLSAIITPPDIFSMLFMMFPLYLLFEFSIWLGKLLIKDPVKKS